MKKKRGLAVRSRKPDSMLRPLRSPRQSRLRSWLHGRVSTETIPGPSGRFLADTPSRVAAWITDAVVLSIPGFLVLLVVERLLESGTSVPNGLIVPGPRHDTLSVARFVIVIGGSGAYYILLWSVGRATVGMRLLGLRVGRAIDGDPIGYRPAAIRWLVLEMPPYAVALVVLAGFGPSWLGSLGDYLWPIALLVSIARSTRKQGFHDRAAHTIVVKGGSL